MGAIFSTLEAFHTELMAMGNIAPEYWAKQIHTIPVAKSINRVQFILARCTERTVLHIGCDGELDKGLCQVAKRCYGIDKTPLVREHFIQCDLDQLAGGLPWCPDVEVVVCGEVVEHLSNAGTFLDALHAYPVPIIITVPNAFNEPCRQWMKQKGRENVNPDHVAYYSYTTLKTLLTRHRFSIKEFYWYNGVPYFAEGLIVVVEAA